MNLVHDPRRLEPREALPGAFAGMPHHFHVEAGARLAVRALDRSLPSDVILL